MTARTRPAPPLLHPGLNCWTVERADRCYVVQDGDYYRLFRDAVLRATRTVFILAWDITASTELLPNGPADGVPSRLDRFLIHVATRRPTLNIFILTWDYGLLFAMERDPFTRWRLGWRTPSNVTLVFDDHHPIGACHHQKVVVIDDTLAFSGGMDLTGHRWDTCAHRVDEPGRVNAMGRPYEPYHEVMAMLEGPAAAKLGELARHRWRAAGATRVPDVAAPGPSVWPPDVTPDFTNVDVAIARTMPGTATRPAVVECERLYLDAIAAATRTLYIENQYFTHPGFTEALATRLREPDGPEVVLVLPRGGDGWIEQNTIQVIRDSLFRRLAEADVHGRLRIVYPAASRRRQVTTFVHSKVLIVDDALLIVGSANTNRRSMGMDTECDVAVVSDGGPASAAIAAVRHRLVAEHLGLDREQVDAAITGLGSLRRLIDARQRVDRTLVPFDVVRTSAPPLDDTVQYVVDPDEPLSLGDESAPLVPALDDSAVREDPPVWVPRGVAVVNLIPLELLFLAAGLMFGAGRGAVIAAGGSLVLAVVGYLIGRLIGPAAAGRLVSRRSFRSIRQLDASSAGGVAMLRLAGVASANAIHLLCGAGRVPFGAYLAGTALGLAPAIVALTALGALLGDLLVAPTVWTAVTTAATALGVLGCALVLRAVLQIRQFAPAMSRQRARTELG